MRSEEKELKDRFLSAAGIPRDVALKAAVVTLTGQREALIENYRRIIEYTDSLVLVETKNCRIRLSGKNLSIEYYTADEMRIKGRINSLEYIK